MSQNSESELYSASSCMKKNGFPFPNLLHTIYAFTGKEVKCPDGHYSENGFTPGCTSKCYVWLIDFLNSCIKQNRKSVLKVYDISLI